MGADVRHGLVPVVEVGGYAIQAKGKGRPVKAALNQAEMSVPAVADGRLAGNSCCRTGYLAGLEGDEHQGAGGFSFS